MERDVLVIGEALVDVVTSADGSTAEHAGGSAANVAVALARLGRRVRFATAYGDDEHGRMIAKHLAESGVQLAGDPHVIGRTSTATATIGADGSATYTFDLEWRLGDVPVDEPRFVHVCSIGAVLPPGADQVVALLDGLPDDVTVTYDVNARPAITGTGADVVARVERIAALVDVVKASDEDLHALYPYLAEQDAARRLLGLGAGAVAITRGAHGSRWITEAGLVEAAARTVRVADTIGAGDTFAAAIIDGLWDGLDRDPGLLLDRAGRAAAINVSRPGANPPYRWELDGAD